MNRLKDLISKFRYELSVFTALSMNFLLFFTKEELMSDILYPLHLVDLNAGFISRTLVGSISGLLWKNPTKENIIFLHTAVVILTFLLTSLFLGKCIKEAEEKSSKALFIITIITAVFPYGFMSFINLFELLDIYWLLSAVLCLLVSENKITAFLIPVFIFTGLWVHFSFLFAFMPLLYILCFSKIIKERSRSTLFLAVLTVTVSVPATLYFFLTQRIEDPAEFESFINYLIQKAGSEITETEKYLGNSFRSAEEMYRLYDFENIPAETPSVIKLILGHISFTFTDTTPFAVFCDFLLAAPPVIFFEAIWKKAAKYTADKKERFIYTLAFLTPIVQTVACFTSSDTSRWLSLMIISQLFISAVLLKERYQGVTKTFENISDSLGKYKVPLIFITLFYLSIVFVW